MVGFHLWIEVLLTSQSVNWNLFSIELRGLNVFLV